jgi:hypothetical protein
VWKQRSIFERHRASRAQPEVHQLFLGDDSEARPGFSINVGGGFDLGSRGPGFVLKAAFSGIGIYVEIIECNVGIRRSGDYIRDFMRTYQMLLTDPGWRKLLQRLPYSNCLTGTSKWAVFTTPLR